MKNMTIFEIQYCNTVVYYTTSLYKLAAMYKFIRKFYDTGYMVLNKTDIVFDNYDLKYINVKTYFGNYDDENLFNAGTLFNNLLEDMDDKTKKKLKFELELSTNINNLDYWTHELNSIKDLKVIDEYRQHRYVKNETIERFNEECEGCEF